MDHNSPKSILPTVRELMVGSGIGLLVGLLIGLAVSEIVGGVIAGLTALLAAFLGLEVKSKKEFPESSSTIKSDERAWRLASFGIVCAMSILLGMSIRTYNLLGPSLQEQLSQWQDVGFNIEEARSLVAYQVLGVVPEQWRTVNEDRVTGRKVSALFATVDKTHCGTLNPKLYSDSSEYFNAYQLAGGQWQTIAGQIEVLSNKQRKVLLTAVWQLACEAQDE